MSELVKKYSVDILKKINFELGNAIKTACDVSWETGGVGTKDRLKGQEQELLQVRSGMHKHNTETSLEPGWCEPMLSQASHETCSGDQDGSMDDVVHGREHVSMLRVDEEEALYDVQEGADEQVQVFFYCNGIRSAQAYSRNHVGDAGRGRETSSMLRVLVRRLLTTLNKLASKFSVHWIVTRMGQLLLIIMNCWKRQEALNLESRVRVKAV